MKSLNEIMPLAMPPPKPFEEGKPKEGNEMMFLPLYSPVELIELANDRYKPIPKEVGVYGALSAPKINAYITQEGEDQLIGFIVNHLTDLMNWFLVKAKPDPIGLDAIAEFIRTEYPEWTLDDVRLFCASMKRLEVKGISNTYAYPKIYERLDGAIMQECLRVYAQAKAEATRKYAEEMQEAQIRAEREINRQNWTKYKENKDNENSDEFLWE